MNQLLCYITLPTILELATLEANLQLRSALVSTYAEFHLETETDADILTRVQRIKRIKFRNIDMCVVLGIKYLKE